MARAIRKGGEKQCQSELTKFHYELTSDYSQGLNSDVFLRFYGVSSGI